MSRKHEWNAATHGARSVFGRYSGQMLSRAEDRAQLDVRLGSGDLEDAFMVFQTTKEAATSKDEQDVRQNRAQHGRLDNAKFVCAKEF